MPYINKNLRKEFDKDIKKIVNKLNKQDLDSQDGCLNYIITKILLKTYLPKYFNYNRAIGMLECCKLEFYRRSIANYEDIKIKENGDL